MFIWSRRVLVVIDKGSMMRVCIVRHGLGVCWGYVCERRSGFLSSLERPVDLYNDGLWPGFRNLLRRFVGGIITYRRWWWGNVSLCWIGLVSCVNNRSRLLTVARWGSWCLLFSSWGCTLFFKRVVDRVRECDVVGVGFRCRGSYESDDDDNEKKFIAWDDSYEAVSATSIFGGVTVCGRAKEFLFE